MLSSPRAGCYNPTTMDVFSPTAPPGARQIPFVRSALFALVALLLLTLVTPKANALDDPEREYFTLTTPHFYLHYDDQTEALAHRAAVAFEEAHQILTPLLDWVPRGRTHVVVSDRIDTANGFARVFGRNFITIYGMPPQADSVLGYYDDWLRVLAYHEYVHILHIDTNPGIPQLVNRVVGKQFHPNATLPRWYTEGIATYFETAHAGTGRVESPLFGMWLRTAALEDRLFTLGQSTGLPVQWPSGSAAYLYGGFFADYIARHHGQDFIKEFNHRYGRRVIPYALNRTAKQISSQTFDELWAGFTAEAQGKARARQVLTHAQGASPVSFVTRGGGRHQYPTLRPGPRPEITYYASSQRGHPAFESVVAGGLQPRQLLEAEGGAGPMAWTPDGRTLVYARSDTYRSVYAYQDLFAYDTQTGLTRRLTRGDRAREPALSPDGRLVAHVRNRGGTMELVVREFDEPEQARVLVSGLHHAPDDDAHWQQISRPIFGPEGDTLIFSWWRLDRRQRDLWEVSLSDGALRQLTDTAAHEMDPHLGPEGALYFAADVEGVFNIFAMDLHSGQAWQVSNVITGAFSPAVSPRGDFIYVSLYTAAGFEIARLPHPRTRRHPDRRATERSRARVRFPEPELDLEPAPYRAARWLAPQFLRPDAGVLRSGAGFGASIEGGDPLDRHTYTLSGGVTTAEGFDDPSAGLGLIYRYGGLPFNVSALARFQDYPRTRHRVAESRYVPFLERQYLGQLSLSYPLRVLSDRVGLSASYRAEYTTYKDRPPVVHEPGDIRPREPLLGWFNELSMGLSYSRLYRYPESISAERGISASISMGIQHPMLGHQNNALTLGWGLNAYYPNPLFERHVLALRLRGALTRSASGREGQYSIGGLRPQEIFTSVIFQEPRVGYPIRGFEPGAMRGSQYQLAKLEYRFPILDLDKGFSTLPLFFRQIKGQVFLDTGSAYNGYLSDAQILTGIGAEVQLDAILGYYASNSLRLGYARGLGPEGLSDLYLLLGASF
ncbi:hypothetical protein DL240_00010 [Lujinxingia litoralis]|uniref:Bacterial surface antigen (D15) domain-containing protein n=1 Tax=Lujinxingia litoralis TaxID=2211119 RepID=A0A328C946_9DELT|nr:PD40 domain-containing protein [Lujinxingia litoralis]RAL24632.1 hypothetical protein DL240_00010 [Lujinxingia litoralis]